MNDRRVVATTCRPHILATITISSRLKPSLWRFYRDLHQFHRALCDLRARQPLLTVPPERPMSGRRRRQMLLSIQSDYNCDDILGSVKGISLTVTVQYVVLANITCGSCQVAGA